MRILRFKMLARGYPRFKFPEDLMEEVDLTTFLSVEENRLPLFVETQFGRCPQEVSLNMFEGKKVATLYKSMLSGHQASICIYEITGGEKFEIEKLSLKKPFWDQEKLKAFDTSETPLVYDSISGNGFNLQLLENYLNWIDISFKNQPLHKLFHRVTSDAYAEFILQTQRNARIRWIGFLGTKYAELYLEIYRLLDKSQRLMYPNLKDLPLPLEKELRMFRSIRNPFAQRSDRSPELPVEEDLLLLSDLGLCVCYNNYININSLEALVVQKEVLEELRHRGYYLLNEQLLKKNANPIEIWDDCGIPVIRYDFRFSLRWRKDIAPRVSGSPSAQIMYEHFYGTYDLLTDMQLVKMLNTQIGIRHWGMGRAALVRALRSQLQARDIDDTCINTETGFSLKSCVVLQKKKLRLLGDLSKDRLSQMLKWYLSECYASIAFEQLQNIFSDKENLQILDSRNRVFRIPLNDLLQKKGQMIILDNLKK